jgi:hypothetical protein
MLPAYVRVIPEVVDVWFAVGMRTTSAHPDQLRLSAAVVGIIASVGTVLTGCGSSNASKPPHTAYTVLTSGTFQGSAWQLFGWEQAGHLCMELLPAGSDPDHVTPPRSWPAGAGGGCEFDKRDPSTGYFTGSPGPGRSSVSFGPLPDRATQIRVAANEILQTTPLPQGEGLPEGRYWIQLMPAGWPTRADGPALGTPQPLNSAGQPVDFQDF